MSVKYWHDMSLSDKIRLTIKMRPAFSYDIINHRMVNVPLWRRIKGNLSFREWKWRWDTASTTADLEANYDCWYESAYNHRSEQLHKNVSCFY